MALSIQMRMPGPPGEEPGIALLTTIIAGEFRVSNVREVRVG
jgi:hypothetical protein